MAITEAHAGRRYSLSHPYHVSAAKIAEFATALGDDNPRYRGESPVAPPTFAAVISAQAWNQMFADPELELALERIVHGDQRFAFFRPLRAGDVVIATAMIDKVRIRAGSELISATVEIAALGLSPMCPEPVEGHRSRASTSSARISGRDGEPICTAQATFYHAREAVA
jgi:N-terminal half of MaoC dehydratase